MSINASETPDAPQPHHHGLRIVLRALYHGSSPGAVRFRLAVIAIDLAIIGFFIVSPILRNQGLLFYLADYLIAAVLAVDMAARAMTYSTLRDWLKEPVVWSDLIVLGTLLFPTLALNFGFLRALRLWSLVNSEFFWRTVGRRYDDTRVEDVVKAIGSLITFVFVATGFIYAAFIGRTAGRPASGAMSTRFISPSPA